jgi:hypothetical protein
MAFVFPLAQKNFPWVVLISGSSIVSQVISILLCLTCYLDCTLIGLAVLHPGLFVCRAALGKHRDEAFVIIGCVTFVVMEMFLSYSTMLVNDIQGVTVLVEKSSFTSELLSNVPLSIKATFLGPAAYLAGMLATLVALWALSFLVALALSVVAKMLLPPATRKYPKLRFATILVLTFMGMKYMLDNSALLSGMKATLLGLAEMITHYHAPYLVMRYVIFLALALLSSVSISRGTYYKAATIISLGVVLTMPRPAPGQSTPVEKPALICKSPPVQAASAVVLGDFIRISEEMMVEHKMAMEKIVSEFNLLIEESKRDSKSFVVHTILVLMTLIGGMVLYVRDQYTVWINTLTEKCPGWMKWMVSRETR